MGGNSGQEPGHGTLANDKKDHSQECCILIQVYHYNSK